LRPHPGGFIFINRPGKPPLAGFSKPSTGL
jgi:hypothetical protein